MQSNAGPSATTADGLADPGGWLFPRLHSFSTTDRALKEYFKGIIRGSRLFSQRLRSLRRVVDAANTQDEIDTSMMLVFQVLGAVAYTRKTPTPPKRTFRALNKGVFRTRTLRRVMDIVKLKKFRPSMMDRHHLILRAVTRGSQRLPFALY